MVRRPRPDRVPTPTRLPRRGATGLTAVIAVGLTVVAATTGCSKDHEALGPTAGNTAVTTGIATVTSSSSLAVPATVTTVAATTTPATAEEQVKAAYLTAVRTYYERLENPDPDDPTIRDHHTDASLRQVIDHNRELRNAGRRERFTKRGIPMPRIRSIRFGPPGSAELTNCVVDDVVIYDRATGKVVDDSSHSFVFRSTLRDDRGVWKLAEQIIIEKTDGTIGCGA